MEATRDSCRVLRRRGFRDGKKGSVKKGTSQECNLPKGTRKSIKTGRWLGVVL